MIGKLVTVTDVEGRQFEGLFHECSENSKQGMEIVLHAVYEQGKGDKGMVKPLAEIRIPMARFAQINVKQLELAKDTKGRDVGAFATDTEISGGTHGGGRELVAFQFDQSVDLRCEPLCLFPCRHIATRTLSALCGISTARVPVPYPEPCEAHAAS
jgi:hypothetical protein